MFLIDTIKANLEKHYSKETRKYCFNIHNIMVCVGLRFVKTFFYPCVTFSFQFIKDRPKVWNFQIRLRWLVIF
jgi:hypothetical protein